MIRSVNKARKNFDQMLQGKRSTTQPLLPMQKPAASDKTGYDIYPAFPSEEPVYAGLISLAGWMLEQRCHQFVIDGYSGVFWEPFMKALREAFNNIAVPLYTVPIDQCLKDEAAVDKLIAPFLGNGDPSFGRLFTGDLSAFFCPAKLLNVKPQPSQLSVVYGTGAALANWAGPVIYLDLPKNEVQYRARAGQVKNLGAQSPVGPKAHYKRSYFIDWPVLNRHKRALLPNIGVFIDEQRISEITWMKGSDLRKVLQRMSSGVIRCRPWFEPGVWGGQWLKNNIRQLNGDSINYAWSFELIAPENGILIEYSNLLLEISFDMLLFVDNRPVLGKAAERFGYTFPIRFNFLDTMDGGPLSLQCHPRLGYAKENFGEDFTQDETYYILQSGAEAEVYLGFRENIDAGRFKSAVEKSFRDGEVLDVREYVQAFPTQRHDLYLIPNGTIHCSGKDNLVLEISATPYIYTFKIYDWIRPDLNGQPRNLHIERALDNLDFTYQGAGTQHSLRSETALINSGTDWQRFGLSTHREHFYAVERYEFDSSVQIATEGQCHVLNLVEGDRMLVITDENRQEIHYAETFIVPAAARRYTLINQGPGRAKVVKAFVKDAHC